MHVAISLLTLAPGDLGGSEPYARQLLRALGARGAHEYTAIVPNGARDAAGDIPCVVVEGAGTGGRGARRIASMSLAARRSRALRARLREVDAVHYPLTVRIPRAGVPTIVTLHDLQHRDFPEFFSRSRRLFRRFSYDAAAKSAEAVIAPSEFVRGRAVAALRLDPERVHVIPHGVDHTLFSPAEGPRRPFLLYPAHTWPHKNHRRLLEAFRILRDEVPELRLVLTGGGMERLGRLPEGVDGVGMVPLEELASLYRTAACLVFPSMYEGFGLPLLEAMASGCPVAAANAGAIPEVCADAALLFDPADVDAIANGVRDALALADDLSVRGIERAAAFSWDESARRHEDVYRAAAS